MLQTKTRTKVVTNTHLALATTALALSAGLAAFAAVGSPQERYYSFIEVSCHDGSSIVADQYISVQRNPNMDSPQASPGIPCFTAREAQNFAQNFCQGKRNNQTGKIGVNNQFITGKCEQPPQNYGYGYGTKPTKK